MASKNPSFGGKILLSGETGGGIYMSLNGVETTIVDENGNVDAPVTSTNLTLSGTLDVAGVATFSDEIIVGTDASVGNDLSIGNELGVASNVTVGGNLTVGGVVADPIIFQDAATLNGGADFDGGKVTIDDVTGDARFRGYLAKKVVVAAKTTTTTLTAAEVVGGMITANQGAGAGASYTLPSGTNMDTALPNFETGDSVDFTITNISTNAAEDVTVLGGSGTTLLGSGAVASNAAATDKSAGTFRFVKTGTATYNVYRV